MLLYKTTPTIQQSILARNSSGIFFKMQMCTAVLCSESCTKKGKYKESPANISIASHGHPVKQKEKQQKTHSAHSNGDLFVTNDQLLVVHAVEILSKLRICEFRTQSWTQSENPLSLSKLTSLSKLILQICLVLVSQQCSALSFILLRGCRHEDSRLLSSWLVDQI